MVAMASEPSPNLQLWTGCRCSLNPDPICFFNFRLPHLTLTILGLPWLKMFNPFFPTCSNSWSGFWNSHRLHSASPRRCAPSLKPEPPGPGSSVRRHPAVHSILTPWMLKFPLLSCCFWTICTTCHAQREALEKYTGDAWAVGLIQPSSSPHRARFF